MELVRTAVHHASIEIAASELKPILLFDRLPQYPGRYDGLDVDPEVGHVIAKVTIKVVPVQLIVPVRTVWHKFVHLHGEELVLNDGHRPLQAGKGNEVGIPLNLLLQLNPHPDEWARVRKSCHETSP